MVVQKAETITRLGRGTAESVRIGPERVTLLVPGSESNGRQLVIEVTTPPGGGPPLHTHTAQEVFFVIEGDFEFPTILDGQPHSVAATAGEAVFIPGGVPHTYKNVGQQVGRLFGVFSPPLEMEAFFREAGSPDDNPDRLPSLDDPLDIPRLMQAAAKYQMEFFKLDHD